LEDEKIHINNGLKKIQETQEQVKELQLSLNEKRSELEEKKQAAEAKLKQMLSDQNDAEREKKISETLQGEMKDQLRDISQKKLQVGGELATVSPIRTSILLLLFNCVILRSSRLCKVPRMQYKESRRVAG
jgi:dynein heavy chain 1